MSGTSAWLADRVASLLPKTTAGACIPPEPWTSNRTTCGPVGNCCDSSRTCHYSCHGAAECGGWVKYYCW
jgi:hypothetical protein